MSPRPRWRTRAAPVLLTVGGVGAVAMVTGGAQGTAARVVPAVLAGGAVAVAVWAVFRWRADRRAYEQRLTAWAASEAVLAERMRIAGDLHDIVSHGLGLITVRAASTRHLDKPPEVAAALTDIEHASRGATAELRRMLTVLREPAAPWSPASPSLAPRAPVEDLSALPGIVRAAERAGVRPELTVSELGEVSPGVQVAVCRTVREALSNTIRHAGPTEVRVDVRRDGKMLTVSVADAGPAVGWAAVPGAGHGLVGLRERVAALGGTLTTGRQERGFRLTAHIPDEAGA
ncbi:sensor histidine kinase [Actinoplanes sp. URMC 104]|uniref:sensor histidine kinase n=1 Tax=Actinoplanes sp. URMC 104 TaxID=3423409 RepID=UPI003F1D5C6E